jgi:sulfane dehydrogenase subunit SoxC
MSVKWRRLRVAAEPTYSREETSKYTDLMPNGSAREFTFYMEAKRNPSSRAPRAASG